MTWTTDLGKIEDVGLSIATASITNGGVADFEVSNSGTCVRFPVADAVKAIENGTFDGSDGVIWDVVMTGAFGFLKDSFRCEKVKDKVVLTHQNKGSFSISLDLWKKILQRVVGNVEVAEGPCVLPPGVESAADAIERTRK